MRRRRVCLIERCRAPQVGLTPLHEASSNGHAAVVEKLLAVGADTQTKDVVSGQREGVCQIRMSWVEGPLAAYF